jgi:hypothetical protein
MQLSECIFSASDLSLVQEKDYASSPAGFEEFTAFKLSGQQAYFGFENQSMILAFDGLRI